ncbi:MAG: lipopolysaccharide biosynthesis protein [Clostridiales bacterium]|nr:lipopolysaccharide biosynthesis protein [Clostridiales bacterium]
MSGIRKKVVSGFAWQFAERAMGQMVSFIVSVVLARILLPAEYGVVSVVLVFITFAGIFITSGFGSSLVQKKEADDLDYSTVFYFNLLISVVLYALLFLGAPWLSAYFGLPSLTPALRVMGLSLLVYAAGAVQKAYISRMLLFKRLFWASLAGTLLSAAVGIWMALRGYGIWALIAQKMTDDVTDALVLWCTVRWRPRLMFSFSRMREMYRYGWKLVLAAVLNTANIKLRAFMIGKAYSVADLAFFEKGNQYPQLVVSDISASIGSVLFPVLSRRQDDPAEIKRLTRRAVRTSSFLMWPGMVILGVIARPLVGWMLTDKWLPCVPYFQIACFSLAFMPIHTSNLQALKAVGRSDLFLALEVVKTVMSLAILVFTLPLGVPAIALGAAAGSVLATFVNAFPNRKRIGYAYGEQVKDILPYMLLSALAGAVAWPLSLAVRAPVPLMLLQAALGFGVYFGLAKLLRMEILTECTSLLREFVKSRAKQGGA